MVGKVRVIRVGGYDPGPSSPLADCLDCPPVGWVTDKTRCATCPRRLTTIPRLPETATNRKAPTVVHWRKSGYTHYIGRRNKAFHLTAGPLQNPYRITPERDRKQVCAAFEVYARNALMQVIGELPEDAVLGCWCHPQECHGDVIVKLWKEIHWNAAA